MRLRAGRIFKVPLKNPTHRTFGARPGAGLKRLQPGPSGGPSGPPERPQTSLAGGAFWGTWAGSPPGPGGLPRELSESWGSVGASHPESGALPRAWGVGVSMGNRWMDRSCGRGHGHMEVSKDPLSEPGARREPPEPEGGRARAPKGKASLTLWILES